LNTLRNGTLSGQMVYLVELAESNKLVDKVLTDNITFVNNEPCLVLGTQKSSCT